MASFNLDESLEKASPPKNLGESAPAAPKKRTQPVDSSRIQAVKAVQQYLINAGFPVRATDPQFADGGWGKITNDSFHSLIDKLSGDDATPEERELGLELGQFAEEDPAATSKNIGNILKSLKDMGQVKSDSEVGREKETAPPDMAEQNQHGQAPNPNLVQKDRGQLFWTVEIPGRGVYKDVPIHENVWSSPANLEKTLLFMNMIDADKRGAERANQVSAAVRGMIAALPQQFSAARGLLLKAGQELYRKHADTANNQHVNDYLNQKFGYYLADMTPEMRAAVLRDAAARLQRYNVLDEEGYLKHPNAPNPYAQDIENLIARYRQKFNLKGFK